MKNKSNVTVVIPVHTHKVENFDAMLQNAIQSIANNTVLPKYVVIVVPVNGVDGDETILHVSQLINVDFLKIGDFGELDIRVLKNPAGTDFATQMNYAVKWLSEDSTYKAVEHFSFLEFDDEYSKSWFSNVEKYMEQYPEVSAFLPIISDTSEEKKFLGYTNEIAWAYEFTDKQGIIDADTLKEYANFNPDGMVMRVADFNRIGGYKKSIKLAFNLEFLLRACDQSLQFMVIPKIGYQHANMRTNSLFWDYKNGDNKLTPEESEFWMETARKEYYYSDDRPVQYAPKAPATETI